MATTYQLDDYVPFGSALRGHLDAPYIDLVDTFGEPNMPFSDKIWNEWAIRFTVPDDDDLDSEEVYVTIYDWKETHPNQSKSGDYRWHIGSKSREAAWLVQDLLDSPETMMRADA
jgi:hypothetical protein